MPASSRNFSQRPSGSGNDLSQQERIASLPSQEPTATLTAGDEVRPGDTVELKHGDPALLPSGVKGGGFLRIVDIIHGPRAGLHMLKGHVLQRKEDMLAPFTCSHSRPNEVAFLLEIDQTDLRTPFEQGVVQIGLAMALRKRNLVITAEAYPSSNPHRPFFNHHEHGSTAEGQRQEGRAYQEGVLVCRSVYTAFRRRNSAGRLEACARYGGEMRRIASEDKAELGFAPQVARDEDVAASMEQRRLRDCGLAASDGRRLKKPRVSYGRKKHKYRFADAFHGLGGASRGAQAAGLRVEWAFDKDRQAHLAYRKNFPSALSFLIDVADFPPAGFDPTVPSPVDILHMSSSCKYVSPAHTRPGKDDQANYEVLFTVGGLLQRSRPRIATMEQTSGLATHHPTLMSEIFNSALAAGTGYNITWKVVNLCEFGVPQNRKRLLVIMAQYVDRLSRSWFLVDAELTDVCRTGIPLPSLPRATHGEAGSGLLPFTCVWDALSPIRLPPCAHDDDAYHDLDSMGCKAMVPFNPKEARLVPCITGNGGTGCHYSGLRDYTPRELSFLQTLPERHELVGTKTAAIKQIANVYPPIAAQRVLEECRKTLEKLDKGNRSRGLLRP